MKIFHILMLLTGIINANVITLSLTPTKSEINRNQIAVIGKSIYHTYRIGNGSGSNSIENIIKYSFSEDGVNFNEIDITPPNASKTYSPELYASRTFVLIKVRYDSSGIAKVAYFQKRTNETNLKRIDLLKYDNIIDFGSSSQFRTISGDSIVILKRGGVDTVFLSTDGAISFTRKGFVKHNANIVFEPISVSHNYIYKFNGSTLYKSNDFGLKWDSVKIVDPNISFDYRYTSASARGDSIFLYDVFDSIQYSKISISTFINSQQIQKNEFKIPNQFLLEGVKKFNSYGLISFGSSQLLYFTNDTIRTIPFDKEFLLKGYSNTYTKCNFSSTNIIGTIFENNDTIYIPCNYSDDGITFSHKLASFTKNQLNDLKPKITSAVRNNDNLHIAVSSFGIADSIQIEIYDSLKNELLIVKADSVHQDNRSHVKVIDNFFKNFSQNKLLIRSKLSYGNISSNFSDNFFHSTDPIDQKITFDSLPDKQIGDTTIIPLATSSSGLLVSMSISDYQVCQFIGVVYTPSGAPAYKTAMKTPGICTIKASQAGNYIYSPATSITRSFTVSDTLKLDQKIILNDISNKFLDEKSTTLTANTNSNLPISLKSTTPNICSIDGTIITFLNIGSCTIIASQQGDFQYNAAQDVSKTFTIQPTVSTLSHSLEFNKVNYEIYNLNNTIFRQYNSSTLNPEHLLINLPKGFYIIKSNESNRIIINK